MIETTFNIGYAIAGVGWLILLVGLFLPAERRTIPFVLAGFAAPGLISAAYLALFAHAIAVGAIGADDLDLSSAANVAALLSSELGATIGWFHYLAFDLAIGAWIARDGLANGTPRWALIPILAATFLAGPVGFLVYLVARTARGRGRAPAVT